MDTERWQRVGDIFERLQDVPADQRETLLLSLCAGDGELKRIVVSMLDSQNSAHPFGPDSAATDVAQKLTHDHIRDFAENALAEAALQDSRIGPWRLVRKIGTGGMGVVWLAERADGQFQQRAALKLIKRGMDSEAVLARFLRERQILARLEHPNIARLLDGGITADGRPYFAMEYIEGLPLLAYASKQRLKLDQRIRLFLEICASVEFAHANHVVHRDIKPSNVLVTANGSVKLLDFGIAKMLQNDSSETTLTSAQRDRPMTPAYAAPEQISGDEISEATDVYALGGVLYELLTDRRAYDLTGANDARDVLRIIAATDPIAPSRLKLTTTPVPSKQLRGDLDVIVLTALKQEPARRYANVAAFAADLRNYLDGQPIAARRDHVLYRGYKFIRRHRTGAAAWAAVALIACALIGFESLQVPPSGYAGSNAALAIVDFNNLTQNKEQAWIAPALAKMLSTELSLGSQMHALPDELVRNAGTDLAAPLAGGYAPQSLSMLRKRLGADLVLSGSYLISGTADEPKLRFDLAVQDTRTGIAVATVEQTGALSDLPTMIQKAGSDLRSRLGFAAIGEAEKQQVDRAQPPNTDVARHMGIALEALHKSDPAKARDELLEAVALAPSYAPTYLYLAQAWKALGYESKAIANAQRAQSLADGLPPDLRLRISREVAVQKSDWTKALELDQQLLALDPKNFELRLTQINDLTDAGKWDAVASALRQVQQLPDGLNDPRVDIAASTAAKTRSDPQAQLHFAQTALAKANLRDERALAVQARYRLAQAQESLGDLHEAEMNFRETVSESQRIGNPRSEANAHVELANIYALRKDRMKASQHYDNAREIYQRIGSRQGLGFVYEGLMQLLWNAGDSDGAAAAAAESLALRREVGDLAGEGAMLSSLAYFKMDDAITDEVMKDFRMAVEIDERAGAKLEHAYALRNYAEALRLRGELKEASKICEQLRIEVSSMTDPAIHLASLRKCSQIALDRGDLDGAMSGMLQAKKIAADIADDRSASELEISFAEIDIANKKFSSARDRLLHALRGLQGGESHPSEAQAQSLLAICFNALNQPTERDQSIALANTLRNRATARREIFPTDLALSKLDGAMGRHDKAMIDLRALGDEATKRLWIANLLETQLATLQLMEKEDSPKTSAARLRNDLQTSAQQLGFGWILIRMRPTPDRKN